MIAEYKILDKTGLRKEIESIRSSLEDLRWLEAAFGKAWLLTEGDGKVPKILMNDREYYTVMPNDDYKSFSFFIGRGPAEPVEYIPFSGSDYWQKNVDLIFYFNLRKIDHTKPYNFTDELEQQVTDKLKTLRGVVIEAVYDETVEEIYQDFDIRNINRDLLYYPFGGLRYRLRITYQKECI